MKLMRLVFLSVILLSFPSMVWGQWLWQQQFYDETGINYNPRGASTRARGMGNAYIALSDDPAGATWNPAGAAFLKEGEAFIEFNSNNSTIESDLEYKLSNNIFSSFGYLSPVRFYHHDWTIGINYYRLFDLSKEYDVNRPDLWRKYYMKFGIEVIKVTAATQVVPDVSMGINGNVYIRGYTEDVFQRRPGSLYITGNDTTIVPYHYRNKGSFTGINFDFGLQGRFSGFHIGAVVTTPFKLRQNSSIKQTIITPEYGEIGIYYDSHMKIDFPLGYGAGVAYNPIEQFTIAADYSSFKFSESRNTIHPIFFDFYNYFNTTFDPAIPNVEYDPNWEDINQYRVGAEYIINVSDLRIPLRAGYSNDPKLYSDITQMSTLIDSVEYGLSQDDQTPYGTTGYRNQVDGYLFTLGTGIKYRTYKLDIAYEYGKAERSYRRAVVELLGFDDDGQIVWGDLLSDETYLTKEKVSRLYISVAMQF